MLQTLIQRARLLKTETVALYFAMRDPRTPWYVKLLVVGMVAYGFCPVDLLTDFIPVIGWLDDLIVIPLGISTAIRLIPAPVFAECRMRAESTVRNAKRIGWIAGGVILAVWLAAAGLIFLWIYEAVVS